MIVDHRIVGFILAMGITMGITNQQQLLKIDG
jgi:hypothetical protein